MADISKIILPNNTDLDIRDANALPLSAGSSFPLTGDLYFSSGCQIHGGLTPNLQRNISDVSRAGNAWHTIYTHQNVPKGNWLLYFQYTFNSSATVIALICITRSISDLYDPIIARQHIYAYGSNVGAGANCIGFMQEGDFGTNETMDFSFRLWLSANATQKGYTAGMIRIG